MKNTDAHRSTRTLERLNTAHRSSSSTSTPLLPAPSVSHHGPSPPLPLLTPTEISSRPHHAHHLIDKFHNQLVSKFHIDKEPFGKVLDKLMAKQMAKLPFLHVPWIIKKCSDTILHGEVDSSLPLFGASYKKKLNKFPELSPLEASNIIKRFLCELPSPLFPSGRDQHQQQLSASMSAVLVNPHSPATQREIFHAIRHSSRFTQALLKELFFVCHQLVERGKSKTEKLAEELVVIFADNFLTADEKKLLCVVLITDYGKIFSHVDTLRPGKTVSTTISESKAIQVYYEDGKCFSLDIKSSSTTQLVTRKFQALLKLQNDIFPYQILDRQIRKIDPTEIICDVCAVIWSGSILYTSVKLEISENLGYIIDNESTSVTSSHHEEGHAGDTSLEQLVLMEVGKRGTTASEFMVGSSTGSFDDSKALETKESHGISPRSGMTESDTSRTVSTGQVASHHLGIGTARSLNASSTFVKGGGGVTSEGDLKPFVQKVTLFQDIPRVARSLDWKGGEEAELILSIQQEGSITFQIAAKTKQFNFTDKHIFTLQDSSSHFAFVEQPSLTSTSTPSSSSSQPVSSPTPLGIAFPNRTLASIFRQTIARFKLYSA